MAQYLVAIHHPDDYDPSTEGEAMSDDIHALNREMVAAGVRIFAGGLSPANVGEAIRRVRPFGVDVTTGVESSPGRKDPHRLRAFAEAVRSFEP